jgi:hypothetical protein
MNSQQKLRSMLTATVVVTLAVPGLAADKPTPQPVKVPPADVVRASTLQWVAERGVTDKELLTSIGKLWAFGDPVPSADERFELVIRSFGLADRDTQAFLDACRLNAAPLLAPEAKPLANDSAGPFYLAHLRLYYGRYLTHRQMFEEALEVLNSPGLEDVADPASWLFFKAVCEHRLLRKADGLKTLDRLVNHTPDVPVRYFTLAGLMQSDLEALRDESLDEISRKMKDVERRLTLGRTGPKVRKVEDEIVASLDELIKKIEQQQGGGGGGGQGGPGNQPNDAARDSSVKGSTAPGNVDKKKVKTEGGWGSLPDKSRARAKDQITRDFPANYRDAVEQYFKKLATRTEEGK